MDASLTPARNSHRNGNYLDSWGLSDGVQKCYTLTQHGEPRKLGMLGLTPKTATGRKVRAFPEDQHSCKQRLMRSELVTMDPVN